jgi:rod shape-determining protein MreC
MIILLLSSVLLITLDLLGNAVFNAARTGFSYALRPFEIAGDVVTQPIERMWDGITRVDDLEAENRLLQQQVDAQRSGQIAAENALIENRELRAALNLESLTSYDKVTAGIIGSSPSNFDQRVEIDRGALDGIKIGMPVVNDAGLVGKITNVSPETSIVMLVTDPLYSVPVKVVAEVPLVPQEVETDPTVPSGIPVGDVTTTTDPSASSTTGPESDSSSTTVPTDETGTDTGDADETDTDTDETADSADSAEPAVGQGSPSTTTSSTTTTTTEVLVEVTRETGSLDGYGGSRLPRIRFIADSTLFGRILVGDSVLTSGGSKSLAPPNIPVGRVANVIRGTGSEGLQLEVELNADLERLNFLTVILYQPPTELVTE